MFDYVSRKDFDAEHDLRVKAEALIAHLFASIETERAAHRAEVQDLFDRFVPKPKDPVPGFGVAEGRPLTYEEIMGIPAVGRRGMRARNSAAHEAKLREELKEKNGDASTRRATLSPEEQALIDKQIPT